MTMSVRISEKVATTLRELANKEHRTVEQVLADAIASYQRSVFWQDAEATLRHQRSDPVARQNYLNEIAHLEGGSPDGLQPEAAYYSQPEIDELLTTDPSPRVEREQG